MDTMTSPRKTKLYNEIAKDFQPKQAEMKICKYIQDMEARIEKRLDELDAKYGELMSDRKPAGTDEKKTPKKPRGGSTATQEDANTQAEPAQA